MPFDLARELPHEFLIAVEKIVIDQLAALLPGNRFKLKIDRLSRKFCDVIKMQSQQRPVPVSRFMASHLLTDFRFDGEFFPQLTLQRRPQRFAFFHLAARKLPLMRVPPAFPLADQHPSVPFDHRRNNVHAIIEARMHSEKLLDHFRNPRNVGELPPPAIRVDVSNPACGDMLRLFVRFEADRVAEVRYQVRGCTASIAAGSALTEWMLGRSRAELAGLTASMVEDLVGGLEAASKHAAVLCLDAVKQIKPRQ